MLSQSADIILFQFLLVRLKADPDSWVAKFIDISIPSGAIKSSAELLL